MSNATDDSVLNEELGKESASSSSEQLDCYDRIKHIKISVIFISLITNQLRDIKEQEFCVF